MVCQFYRAWAELLGGRWGSADALLTQSLELAERNGHRSWHVLFAALRAWLLREAGASGESLDLAEKAAAAARQVGAPFGELVADAQLGLTRLETGDTAGALERLEALVARLDREPMLMGWLWRMPVHIGLSTAHRLRRAWAAAEHEARRARDVAAESGEPTWLALGWTEHAELALARNQREEAEDALKHAVAAVANVKAPLAAWRVHACAARAAATWGQAQAVLAQRARAIAVIDQLAGSLPAESALRRVFRDVRQVVEPASL